MDFGWGTAWAVADWCISQLGWVVAIAPMVLFAIVVLMSRMLETIDRTDGDDGKSIGFNLGKEGKNSESIQQ